MTSPARTIVIVGGGFSGSSVAANLLRRTNWGPARVVLVERAAQAGRGTAYAQRDFKYLLNVPAGRMSANTQHPLEFLEFARNTLPAATADDFLPRALYGQYLEASLLAAELSAEPGVRLERVQTEVRRITRVSGPQSFRLHFANGRTLDADDVVLALGNPPPASLPAFDSLLASSRYAEDPWRVPTSCKAGETVLIIGSGLTMADVASAATAAHDDVTIHAISRHGLVPPSQTAFKHRPCDGDSGTLLREASFSARRLMRAVRQLAAEMQEKGSDWREAVTFVRALAPAIWNRLPQRERRRFLRHVRPYWDIHRHRLPQETISVLEDLRASNRLHVHAGRLLSAERCGDKVRVTWRGRGKYEPSTLVVDRVINCTGPEYNPHRSRDPLLQSLLSQQLATTDALGLGLRTGAHGALLDSYGDAVGKIYYIGPLLRADHWEATAAQELRSHAERLASHLASAGYAAFGRTGSLPVAGRDRARIYGA